nr:hypothetical protein CFP56_66507 [Quercus suber]
MSTTVICATMPASWSAKSFTALVPRSPTDGSDGGMFQKHPDPRVQNHEHQDEHPSNMPIDDVVCDPRKQLFVRWFQHQYQRWFEVMFHIITIAIAVPKIRSPKFLSDCPAIAYQYSFTDTALLGL